MTPTGRFACVFLLFVAACSHKGTKSSAAARPTAGAASTRPGVVTPEEGVLAAVAGVPPEYAEVRRALPIFEACGLTHEKAARFLRRLKATVEHGDREAMANLMSYPLVVQLAKGPLTVADRQSFLRDYDVVLNEQVRTAVVEQGSEALRATGRGAMVGNGALWFRCPDRLLTRGETGSVTCDGPNIRVVAIDASPAPKQP